MNLSTPQQEGWGLPSIRGSGESFDPELLKTEGLSRAAQVEGLEVHPEPRSFIPPSMVGLRAAEWVKIQRKYE
jgi:hypothetical protein